MLVTVIHVFSVGGKWSKGNTSSHHLFFFHFSFSLFVPPARARRRGAWSRGRSSWRRSSGSRPPASSWPARRSDGAAPTTSPWSWFLLAAEHASSSSSCQCGCRNVCLFSNKKLNSTCVRGPGSRYQQERFCHRGNSRAAVKQLLFRQIHSCSWVGIKLVSGD